LSAESATVSTTGWSIDALWLATLNQIALRSAHELKGALNGVAVNLEVVRSRAEKPDAAASAVRTFANAAAGQLESVIDLAEALLALSRPARQPTEIGRLVHSMSSLLAPAARADGRELQVEPTLYDVGITLANGNAVRVAIGASLLAAIDASPHVDVREGRDYPHDIERSPRPLIVQLSLGKYEATIAADVIAAVGVAGIQIMTEPSVIYISFPR
jgi:signal transduction histidine kinase